MKASRPGVGGPSMEGLFLLKANPRLNANKWNLWIRLTRWPHFCYVLQACFGTIAGKLGFLAHCMQLRTIRSFSFALLSIQNYWFGCGQGSRQQFLCLLVQDWWLSAHGHLAGWHSAQERTSCSIQWRPPPEVLMRHSTVFFAHLPLAAKRLFSLKCKGV